MKWMSVRLGDIADFSNGINFDKTAYGHGIKMIAVSDFGNRFFPDIDQLQEVKMDVVRQGNLLQEGDIVFVRSNGNKELVGRCMLIPHLYQLLTFSGFVIRCRFFEPQWFYPRFFAYYFKTKAFRRAMGGTAIGANIQNLSQTRLSSHVATIPDITTQKTIANILSAYDDLIENNRKQIKLLEEAAQRLYKEWFIDLRFPGYETTPIHDGIPDGWEKEVLDELIEFNPKYTVPKERQKRVFPMSSLSTSSMVLDFSESSYSNSVSGARFSNGDTLLARITPCLENGKTAYVGGLQDGEIAIGSTEFIVMRSKRLNPYMVYLLARSSDFRKTAINSMTGSDGRQRAQVDMLKLFPYLRPSKSVIDSFEHLAKPMFEQIYNLNKQISQLIEGRDRLLPKLMNGEMEV